MPPPPCDIVVFGATSFVGQILTRYLFDEFGLDGELRWAAAGRSLPKLEEVRGSLGRGAGKLPLVQADAGDEASLRKLCRGARVVVSTVGPYALYGETLVRVCAETCLLYTSGSTVGLPHLSGRPHLWLLPVPAVRTHPAGRRGLHPVRLISRLSGSDSRR